MTQKNALIRAKNKIEAEIASIEKGIADSRYQLFVEEVLNLFDDVNIVEGDYYAPKRLYSSLEGVKNIRIIGCNADIIRVKVDSRFGYLLPSEITLRGKTYKTDFCRSKNFFEEVNY